MATSQAVRIQEIMDAMDDKPKKKMKKKEKGKPTSDPKIELPDYEMNEESDEEHGMLENIERPKLFSKKPGINIMISLMGKKKRK